MTTHPDPNKYPALFKRWLRTGEGKRWKAEQSRLRRKANRWVDDPQRDKFPKRGMRWSAEDDTVLRKGWGTLSPKQLADRLGRTQRSITTRARTLDLGLARKVSGSMTLWEFSRYSGFSRSKIRRTAKKLNIRLSRALTSEVGNRPGSYQHQRTKNYAITVEQQQQLLEHMLKE